MYKTNLYKGKYYIAFYDEYGEDFIEGFDTVTNILYYLKKDITRENVLKMNQLVYYAIKNNRTVYFLDGKPRKIYLIKI